MLRIETNRGAPVRHGGRLLVPVAKAIRVTLPGGRGTFLWNRPRGVEVEAGEQKLFLTVPDRTRRIQWALLTLGAAVFLLSRFSREVMR